MATWLDAACCAGCSQMQHSNHRMAGRLEKRCPVTLSLQAELTSQGQTLIRHRELKCFRLVGPANRGQRAQSFATLRVRKILAFAGQFFWS